MSDEGIDALGRFAALALECVHKEYPNKIAHVMQGDEDVSPPRELTPAFFGCYDWHSSVHGHWLLARLARVSPDAVFAPAARGPWSAASPPPTSSGRSSIWPATAGSPSSARTGLPGSFSSPPSCGSGKTLRRAGGVGTWSRWR
jgi:hypothetical protein